MAKQVPNQFTSYEFESDAEERMSRIFTDSNIYMLQNLLAKVAQEKTNLDYTPNDPIKFAQQEAGLKAQIMVLGYLIDQHANAIEEVIVEKQSASQGQSNSQS